MSEYSVRLESIGGKIDSFGDIIFADNKSHQEREYFTLINRRDIVDIKGVDSKVFLQGQLTCDLLAVDQQRLTSGAYCTPKGRVIGNFWLSQWHDNHLCMATHIGGAAALKKQLDKYIVFSKAETSLNSEITCIGLQTNDAKRTLGALFEQFPSGPMQQVIANDCKLIQLDEQGLYELWLPNEKLSATWATLEQHLSISPSSQWDADIIRAGQAIVDAETTELLIPQHMNMQLNGGINFTKGCYTGQEVVARMQYRGKLKRHMYRVSAPTLPQSGAPLFGLEGEQSIGNMLQSCHLVDAQEGLACLTITSVAANAVFDRPASEADRQSLNILSLPYAIPADE